MVTRLTGVMPALVTPFADDGSFDESTCRKLVERQIAAGVKGLVPCGTTGEAASMTPGEHQRVVEVVVEQAAGRVPVLAGVGCNNTAVAMEMSRRCAAAGADALLHVTPYYVKPTQQGLIEHFRAVADAADLPVVLYNVPGRTGVTIAPETVLSLAEDARFIGLKQAVADLDQLSAILRHRPEHFAVLSGEDSLTLPMIALGADGVISVISNETPGAFVRLVAAMLENDLTEARLWHRQLTPLMRANFVESNPIPCKFAMSRMGLIRNNLRLPMTPLSDQHSARVLEALREAQQESEETEFSTAAGAFSAVA